MTCIVEFKTKKDFKEAVERNPNEVEIVDPSIFNPRTFVAGDIADGEHICVTNHPKRSWFASVRRVAGGKLVVK